MHGYKYALIGVAAFGLLGFVLTILLLPHVKPIKATTKMAVLEEGGLPASVKEDDSVLEQKTEVEESYQKQEAEAESLGRQKD